jgi:DNA-binding MarR family transcriptional regulator
MCDDRQTPAADGCDALDAVERELTVFVRRSRRPMTQLRAGDRVVQVSVPSYALLVRLFECEPQRASDLARDLGLDKSTMSRQIAALERDGLLERVEDPADGRAALVRLSPQGRRSLAEMREARRRVLRERLSNWSTQDRRDFARLLGRLNADLGLARPE